MLVSGCLEQVCAPCEGIGTITETCAQCVGWGTVSRELRYRVIGTSVSEGGILDWKAWLTVTIRNLDDKTGHFTVTGTAFGGGRTITSTVGVFIGPGAVEDVVVVLDIVHRYEYSYSYDVTPEIIAVTCPGCGGIGTTTLACLGCARTGAVSKFFLP